ncbi:MAG TPA: TerC family protein [Desulfomonilaceae bacterium]|nr:TerC family protein [Desulfomonilaceae bacterium]
MNHVLLWVAFNVFVLVVLALDLGIFHRNARPIHMKEALVWSVIWTAAAFVFNGLIYWWWDSEAAVAFLTGYVIERFLSMDNLFVFVLIFSYFNIPAKYQHKILFWGILGALIMRAAFIFAGIALVEAFHWIMYVFGAFLILAGIHTGLAKKEIHPEKNPVLKLLRRFVTCSDEDGSGKFFLKRNGRVCATTMFIALVFVEVTDLVFALDSIPAILAITRDPFIVYTSNVFAILGLRALYFALAAMMRLFHYLHYGLAAVLIFIGVKMLASDLYKISVEIALLVVTVILGGSVICSALFPPQTDSQPKREESGKNSS